MVAAIVLSTRVAGAQSPPPEGAGGAGDSVGSGGELGPGGTGGSGGSGGSGGEPGDRGDATPAAPKKRAEVVDAATAARAEKLFHEGRELMKKRSTLDRGCDVLQQSFDLQARGDTLLNLAECHRRQGKTASAWREFDEALDYALSADFKEAIEAAFVLREELAAKLSTVTVNVAEGSAKLPKLVVMLDEKPLPRPQWGNALYQDPGPHVVTARADGHETFRAELVLGDDSDAQSVLVELVPLPPPPAPVPPSPPPPPPPPDEGIPLWVWPVGGAGLAALGGSAIAGAVALGAGNELDDACGSERLRCPSGFDFESVRGRELTGFGFFVGLGVAGVGLVGAATVGIVASVVSDSESASLPIEIVPIVSATAGGVGLSARF